MTKNYIPIYDVMKINSGILKLLLMNILEINYYVPDCEASRISEGLSFCVK